MVFADLRGRGIEAHYFPDNDDLLDGVLSLGKPGDVILFMSSGAFHHIQERLVEGLKEKGL